MGEHDLHKYVGNNLNYEIDFIIKQNFWLNTQ